MLIVVLALVGLGLGALLPDVLRQIPDRESVAVEADTTVAVAVPPPVAAPTYGELAAWPPLRVILGVCAAVVLGLLAAALGSSAALPAFAYVGLLGVLLAYVDVRAHRLPDRLVLPSYAVVLVLLLVAAGVDQAWDAMARAVLGAGALFAVYLVLVLINPSGMGLGDLKLSGVLGLLLGWLGWGALIVGTFAGFLLGGLAGVVLLLTRRASLKSAVPFGPFMLLGSLVAVLAHPG